MKKCIITAETTCDLSQELIDERGFRLIPITVIMGNEEYKDGVNLKAEDLFDYIILIIIKKHLLLEASY